MWWFSARNPNTSAWRAVAGMQSTPGVVPVPSLEPVFATDRSPSPLTSPFTGRHGGVHQRPAKLPSLVGSAPARRRSGRLLLSSPCVKKPRLGHPRVTPPSLICTKKLRPAGPDHFPAKFRPPPTFSQRGSDCSLPEADQEPPAARCSFRVQSRPRFLSCAKKLRPPAALIVPEIIVPPRATPKSQGMKP